MSAEDTELFEATASDTAEGVEEGFGCVVEAEVDTGSEGSGAFTFAAAEDVGTTEEGVGLEEGGTQV